MNPEMSGMKGMDEVIGLLDRDLPKEDALGNEWTQNVDISDVTLTPERYTERQ